MAPTRLYVSIELVTEELVGRAPSVLEEILRRSICHYTKKNLFKMSLSTLFIEAWKTVVSVGETKRHYQVLEMTQRCVE